MCGSQRSLAYVCVTCFSLEGVALQDNDQLAQEKEAKVLLLSRTCNIRDAQMRRAYQKEARPLNRSYVIMEGKFPHFFVVPVIRGF
jgi:hypothetical protein